MAYYKNKPIGERLNAARELINIVQTDPDISERMNRFNYGAEALAEGLGMVDVAARLDLDQRDVLGRQAAATGVMNDTLREVGVTFSSDRRIARNLLRSNKNLYAELRLGIRKENRKGKFLQQARHFYEQVVAREELMALFLDRYRIPAEVFAERLADLNTLEAAMQLQQLRIGETRVAFSKRKAAMQELDTWMGAIIGVARQAFKGEEEQLKKLGVETVRRRPQNVDLPTPPPENPEGDSAQGTPEVTA